jgi:hypothetical protein
VEDEDGADQYSGIPSSAGVEMPGISPCTPVEGTTSHSGFRVAVFTIA